MANAPWINFEVFGHPELYGTGDSQELAQRNLTNFCVMLREDLSKQESLSRDEQNTLEYLQQSIDLRK
jgi:hypothetical protein